MADDPNVADTSGGGDVVVTDRELFDHAISDAKPEPAAPQAPPPQAPQPAPDQGAVPQPAAQEPTQAQRARDEQGRFVPKEAQQPAQKPAPQQPQQRQPEDHRVPLRELLDERERRQRIEAEAAQMRQAWAELQQRAAAMQQQQAPQTIFDNPDEYLQQHVMNPLRQEGQRYMLQVKDGISREMANQQFGTEAIDTALAELTRIRHTPQGDFVFNQIMSAGHPYGALVKWHQQARAQQAIGSDPNAWLQKQYEQWENNPQVQARILQRWQQQQQQKRPPNVSLPPSLSSVPASSSRIEEPGDLSNESLYRFATK